MRKVTVVLAALFAVPLLAQTPDQPLRVSVFVSDPSFTRSDLSGTDFTGGLGLGLEYRWAPSWSAELTAAAEEHHEVISIDPQGQSIHREDIRSYPVDVVARYHFFDVKTRWRPYLGAGARFVAAPNDMTLRYGDRLSAQVDAGVDFNAGDRWSLRLDAKRLLDSGYAPFDRETKFSVGVGWRF